MCGLSFFLLVLILLIPCNFWQPNHPSEYVGSSYEDFKGKVAFMTGATSGVGRATAIAFAIKGASIVVADISEQGATKRPIS
jgi:hypothetical protein